MRENVRRRFSQSLHQGICYSVLLELRSFALEWENVRNCDAGKSFRDEEGLQFWLRKKSAAKDAWEAQWLDCLT